MRVQTWLSLCVASVVVVLVLPGCLGGFPGSRTSNQGGGSLISAGLKIQNGQLGRLTADEVQILADFIMEQQNITTIEPVTDDQAAAIVTFLHDNSINTVSDLTSLDPSTVVISDDVRAVLETLIEGNLGTIGAG